MLHALLVLRVGRGRPAVVADVEFLPKRDEFRRDPVDELLRRDALFFGGLLHFLPVLIDAGEEENLLALQPMITRDDVGEDLLVRMADVRRTVGVIDRGGEIERFRHRAQSIAGERCARNCGPGRGGSQRASDRNVSST